MKFVLASEPLTRNSTSWYHESAQQSIFGSAACTINTGAGVVHNNRCPAAAQGSESTGSGWWNKSRSSYS